ncbi:MAG: Ig domain-containing protein [Lachnospiraceae bacterium]|nr:Ig domain-containing protein [Lachnospiraceae bacterium]
MTWDSSNKRVVTVSNKGVVKGIKAGTATVFAKVGNKKYVCKVTIKKKAVALKSISLNKTSITLKEKGEYNLKVIYNPSDAMVNESVVWSSSDVNVVKVNGGKISAKKAGTAVITAKVMGMAASCRVTVKEQEIEYITYKGVQYDSTNSLFRVFFGLKLEDRVTEVAAPGVATVKIVNDSGEEVYASNIAFTENDFNYWIEGVGDKVFICSLEIPVSDIQKGEVSKGQMSIQVGLLNDSQFPGRKFEISNLPEKTLTIVLENELPATFSRIGALDTILSKTMVTSFDYSITQQYDGDYIVNLDLFAMKIYDIDASGEKWSSMVGYRLYDEEGVLVDSGDFLRANAKVSDVFHMNEKIYSLKKG